MAVQDSPSEVPVLSEGRNHFRGLAYRPRQMAYRNVDDGELQEWR